MISCTWGEDTEVNRAFASSWSQRGTPGKTTNGTQYLPPAPHSTHASDGWPPHGEVMEQRQLPASPNAETHTRNHVLLYIIFWNAPFFKMITNRQWISKREMLGKSEKFWWTPEMRKNQAVLREAQPSTVKRHTGAQKPPRWAESARPGHTALGTLWFMGREGLPVSRPAMPQGMHTIRSTVTGFSSTRRVERLRGFRVFCNIHFIPCRRMIFGSRVKLEATVFVKSYLPGFQENCSIFLRHTISKST